MHPQRFHNCVGSAPQPCHGFYTYIIRWVLLFVNLYLCIYVFVFVLFYLCIVLAAAWLTPVMGLTPKLSASAV